MSRIVVVGDLMIDRNLVTAPGSRHSTSTAHFDVDPVVVIDPKRNPDCIAGAGGLARCLLSGDPNVKVTLLTAHPDGYSASSALPEEPNRPRLRIVRLFKTPFVTTKYRMYAYEGKTLRLRERIDRDLTISDHKPVLSPKDPWPKPSDVDAVVVDHFAKGLLEQPAVRKKLQTYAGKPFLVRSKRPLEEIVTDLPWNYLCIARDDLGRIARRLGRGSHVASSRLFQIPRETLEVNPDIVTLLMKLATAQGWNRRRSNRNVVIRSSGEGVLILSGGMLTGVNLPPQVPRHQAAVGAGDVFLAHLTLGTLLTKNSVDASRTALACEAEYSKPGDSVLTENGHWYATNLEVDSAKVKHIESNLVKADLRLTVAADQTRKRQNFRTVLAAGQIHLHEADWCLTGFSTVDPNLRADVQRLKNGIEVYVKNPAKKRPFVAAICGSPGSGKSTLASALEHWLHDTVSAGRTPKRASKIESNAAQWTSMEELSYLCEMIRSRVIREEVPIVFVDEVDERIAGEQLYGKLLAPTWDAMYFLRGERREIGKGVVFLLAGSDKDWATAKALLHAAERPKNGKLRDLVSRLSTKPVELTSLRKRKADVVYIVALKLQERFPQIRWAHAGLLRLFAESQCVHGPRSIDMVLDMIDKPGDLTGIENSDLSAVNAELDAHLRKRPVGWREDTARVWIMP